MRRVTVSSYCPGRFARTLQWEKRNAEGACGSFEEIEIRASDKWRPTVVLKAPLELGETSAGEMAVTLSGLLVTGSHFGLWSSLTLVSCASTGRLRSLRIQHCTLVPGLAQGPTGEPVHPSSPSVVIESINTHVLIENSVVGGILAADGAEVTIVESIVDATREDGVAFAIRCAAQMHGGEIFVPKIPSMRVTDLVEAVAPGCHVEIIGIRPGEKLHEVLISEDESRQALELDDMFVLEPVAPSWSFGGWETAKRAGAGFRYSSDANDRWLSGAEMRRLADDRPGEGANG